VTLDAGWLADPARVFPVTVDPTFTGVSSSTYAELSALTGDHSMEKTIKIGSYNSGPGLGELVPVAPQGYRQFRGAGFLGVAGVIRYLGVDVNRVAA
jgi:hypothetical protein